jgi:hypothetical protein
LTKNKKNRLGAANGVQEILKHPFFGSLDIKMLMAK